eukprot:TRINITY_DN10023_c0_g1_i5.p1 TRINITY_DN10023_c0_g1~~TRINITY_DN10023_c0_g1_i5.p1  ORF type:complete len:205 (-),score=38.07 TRINITY_DN10023_c0_g1_i5:147-761(-)
MFILIISIRLGYCELLSPFHWEHVLIPVLPDICEGYLEAPVPFLIGVPKDFYENKELFNITWSRDTLIVLLDKRKILYNGADPKSPKASHLPKLKALKEQLGREYGVFQAKRELHYSPSEKQIKAVKNISQTIEMTFGKLLLNEINKVGCKALIKDSTKELDVDAAKKFVKRMAGADAEFLEKFCETQMFASYIKEKYENSTST